MTAVAQPPVEAAPGIDFSLDEDQRADGQNQRTQSDDHATTVVPKVGEQGTNGLRVIAFICGQARGPAAV